MHATPLYVMTTMEKQVEKYESRRPLTTGCKKIDQLLGGGFRPGEITELSGGSRAGKTRLAVQTCLHAIKAFRHQKRVLYITIRKMLDDQTLASFFSRLNRRCVSR